MNTLHSAAELRRVIARWRAGRDVAEARGVAFVPTMGALHEGHLSLIDRARSLGDLVVLSIFVNPLQFGPAEDFGRYPRPIERDSELAAARGTDLLFLPAREELYPAGEPIVRVRPGAMADVLCGAYRPGHFEGVLTVVAKLFNIVQPDVAIVGQKDYQQASLIRRMVGDLHFPVRVDVAPIVRETDGLALSSRNAYLGAPERAAAVSLWRALQAAEAVVAQGERDAGRVREAARRVMAEGARVEYVEVVDPDTLAAVHRVEPGTVLAVAGYVGSTRLIDNLILG